MSSLPVGRRWAGDPMNRQIRDCLAHCVVGLSLLLVAGCATAPYDSPPVPNIAGTWVGELSVRSTLLELGGVMSGELRVTFEQRGRAVTGKLDAPGLTGDLLGRLDGNSLTASVSGEAHQGAGNVRFDGTITEAEIHAVLEDSPVILRRLVGSGQVLMKNPRTDQVIVCQGPQDAVAQCVEALERDGWERLRP